MQLSTSNCNGDISKVQSISKGIVYYAYAGRNAWHSTWVQRYYPGCMHTSIETARQYCEKKRQRGTILYIKELPCLVIKSTTKALFITEINHDCPLDRYSNEAVTTTPPADHALIDNHLDNYLKRGAPLEGVHLSFKPLSRFWQITPDTRDAIIQVECDNPSISVMKCNRDNFYLHKSFSQGSDYYLGWNQKDSNIKRKGVMDILRKHKEDPTL